jgi:hypothetical protein
MRLAANRNVEFPVSFDKTAKGAPRCNFYKLCVNRIIRICVELRAHLGYVLIEYH